MENSRCIRVAVISDTHGVLRPEVLAYLEKSDYIIHAGDICTKKVLDKLESIAPLFIVRGNNDVGAWADVLETEIYFTLGKYRFYLIHDKKLVTAHPEAVDFIIFGHSHKYFHEQQGKTCWLNPGSCGRARFHLPLTMATLELSDNGYEIQCIHIENNKSAGKP